MVRGSSKGIRILSLFSLFVGMHGTRHSTFRVVQLFEKSHIVTEGSEMHNFIN